MSRIFEALTRSGAGGPLPQPSQAKPMTPDPDTTAAQSGREPVAVPTQGVRRESVRLVQGVPVLPFDGMNPKAGEQYRIIRTRIVFHPSQPRMVVVSSPGSGDGKTVSSINIAGALALKSETNVLLVETDFRKPEISYVLGISPSPGLADVLAGRCSLSQAVIQIEQLPRLYVLPAGDVVANPAELLDSARWRAVCADVRSQFHYALFDAPPIAAVADYDLIQAGCDGVIVVVRPDHTNRALCTRVLQMTPPEKLLGAVINCAEPWFMWRAQEYYNYAYVGEGK